MAENIRKLRAGCAGHSSGEYALLAALLGAGLATAVITYLSTHPGTATVIASRLG